MKLSIVLLSAILVTSPVVGEDVELPESIFESVWKEAKNNIYPEALVARFSEDQYNTLLRRASSAKSVYELTPLINQFFDSLSVSHTRFYDNQSIDFYFFRSLFTTQEINDPKVNHIGTQYLVRDGEYVVREVLDGYPASLSGMKRGDIIEEAGGEPFHPYHAFNPPRGEPVQLKIQRGGTTQQLIVDTVFENPNQSMLSAMRNSQRTIDVNGKKIGYLHLWSGTHDEILKSFEEIITNEFVEHDSIILDLRGGFGGAWYDYLDLFFPDRSDYFEVTYVDRNGVRLVKPEPKINRRFFSGPMVVLINEGTRSGKEALAFQFKKSSRAILVGTTTQGAFNSGLSIFTEEEKPYFLFLSIVEPLLDGEKVEGVGVTPDIEVKYAIGENDSTDPQLRAGIAYLEKLLGS